MSNIHISLILIEIIQTFVKLLEQNAKKQNITVTFTNKIGENSS